MSKQTVPDLKELFKQASEIAQQVPESMQEAAFNRALDLLTGNTKPERTGENKNKNKIIEKKTTKHIKDKNKSILDDLLLAIDSTKHPSITSANKALDRSLMVLQIARSDHNIDGLTPSDIATILTEKFRISTSNTSVSKALGRATTLVDRISNGVGYTYKIMAPGEEYLAQLGESKVTKSKPQKRKTKKEPAIKKSTKPNSKKTTTKNTIGPKAAITNLLESGYFSKGRTGPEVRTFLKNKRGFNFGTDQLRLAMLRLIRDHKLDRDENAEGQYEYKES